MSDAYFPPPRKEEDAEGSAYRVPAAVTPTSSPRPVVVRRADASDSEVEASAATKLTKDEIQALLATDASARGHSPLARCGRRAVVIVVPVGLLRWLAEAAFGDYALVATVALFLASLAWVAAPLARQKREGWF